MVGAAAAWVGLEEEVAVGFCPADQELDVRAEDGVETALVVEFAQDLV